MSGTLALASALAEMDRDALHALVAARRPYAAAGITDPIGLAAELLRPDSIQRAILPLDRGALHVLAQLAELPGTGGPRSAEPGTTAALTALGLVGAQRGEPVALPEVTEALQAALAEAGVTAAELAAGPAPREQNAATGDTGTWYSPALTAIGQSAEILRALAARPLKLNRNGTVAVAAVRALADATGIDAGVVPRALTALDAAELTAAQPDAQLLLTTAAARAWLAHDHRARWEQLAEALLAALPQALRRTLSEVPGRLAEANERIPHRFPLLPSAERAAATAYVEVAEQFGCTVDGVLSPPALALLAGDTAAARELIAQDTPGVAPGVYVQPDLSVVVPGPLAPADEAALAAISRPEQIGVASTRRISEGSLGDALEQGITPAAAREFISGLSLTGVPQPLEYLLSSRAERVGELVVHEHTGDEGRTRVAVARPELAETLLVDRALQHLQLMRGLPTADGAAQLFSRLRAEHVLSALADARYQPSSAVAGAAPDAAPAGSGPTGSEAAGSDSAGSESTGAASAGAAGSDPHPPTAATPVAPLTEALIALVDRVHTAARSEPGTGEFTRHLELAMRDKRPVRVTAEARGQVHEFTLLPVSVSGGRLRATDQLAGVERTLPVSMITAVEPV